MAFITTVPVEEADGEVRDIYQSNQASWGFVPNYVKLYSHRPNVLKAWGGLVGAVTANMDPRRYELVSVAAARALRNNYCMLAHGQRLARQFYSDQETAAICADYASTGLGPADVAIMAYAEKVATDATSVTQADIDTLRRHGLSDRDIFDVAAAAAIRCYFTKVIDALGGQPDSAFNGLEPNLRDVLTLGRPISPEPVDTIPLPA